MLDVPPTLTVESGVCWNLEDNILLLEAKLQDSELDAERAGQVCFVRHVSAVFAFAMYRGQDHRLLLQVRWLASLALCHGIKFVARWIPYKINVADGGSREATHTVSQYATRLWGKGGLKAQLF